MSAVAGSSSAQDVVSTDPNALAKTAKPLADASGKSAGTLNNAPVSGDPTKWIQIIDNGVVLRIPAW